MVHAVKQEDDRHLILSAIKVGCTQGNQAFVNEVLHVVSPLPSL